MRYFLPLFMIVFFFGCKAKTVTHLKKDKLKLHFLDEYVFPANQQIGGTTIGGLSGIDYVANSYYFVADDAKNPRIYKADIDINHQKIDTVIFKRVIELNAKNHPFYVSNALDLESIVMNGDNIIITSEGSIKNNANPLLFKIDLFGNFKASFSLPKKFSANSLQKPRHNGTLEGLSKSYDSKGFWSAFELPLEADGKEPDYSNDKFPVRFTYFDEKTHQPIKEFVYELSSFSRPKKGKHNINGLTDILEYKKNHFFVIERTYQSGYTNNENLVRIYKAVIEDDTTNTLQISSLKKHPYKPMKKKLLFDFSSIQSQLTERTIDNIEGITLGPKLPNGNQSLILVSDDNFQKFGKQLNQFVLFEIVE